MDWPVAQDPLPLPSGADVTQDSGSGGFPWPQHSHFEFLTSGDVPGGRPPGEEGGEGRLPAVLEESPNHGYWTWCTRWRSGRKWRRSGSSSPTAH
ncbi:hypothetical protein CEXT_637421 [Caerostris extrusa]|uniref:Uncharacterized protein n=1 Tax=Caerostris extrusa TaxID=172846 RepID=A0AAV4NEZ6_CAEEX|nr:hypothetical protein CEXT_637421 [Caerostris extrusa]